MIFILALMGADSPDFGKAVALLLVEEEKATCKQEEGKEEEKKRCEVKVEAKQQPVKGLESWDEAIQKLQQVQLEQKKLEESKTID